MAIIYKTKAVNFGGRDGHVKVADSPLEFKMMKPWSPDATPGSGANPEQLFAAGYAACFGSAVQHVVRVDHLHLDSFNVEVEIALIKEDDGEYHLAAAITLSVTGMDKAGADALIQAAHRTCPYSKATRGNIDVKLTARLVNESSLQ